MVPCPWTLRLVFLQGMSIWTVLPSYWVHHCIHGWQNKIKLIVGMCYFWNPASKFCSVYSLIFIISIQLSVLEVSHLHFAMLINYPRRIFWFEHKNMDELVLIRTPSTFNIIKRMNDVLHRFKPQSLQPSNIIYHINMQLVIREIWIWLRKSCQIPDMFFWSYSLTWQVDQLWWFSFCILHLLSSISQCSIMFCAPWFIFLLLLDVT